MTLEEQNLELLLDLIAEHLIQSDLVNSSIVEGSQKYIRNGTLQQGAGSGVLALFQKDIKANQEDLNSLTTINPGTDEEQTLPVLQNISNNVDFSTLTISSSLGVDNSVSVFLIGGGSNFPDGGQNITDLVIGDGNPLNVSQFIPLEQSSSLVNIDAANEFLDTNIFELLPSGDERQSRIVRFFQELNALLPPEQPNFDQDGIPGVDRGPDGRWLGDLEYQQNNSISYAQDNTDGNIDEQDAFIHRLKSTANSTNSSRTIEDIYNRVLPYLTDILLDDTDTQDDRQEYVNQSSGFLKFRNPNQGIIVRNTNQDFIEGLNPNNPAYLNTDGTGGFTITMWVRFLDKVSEGTLFNFGNPTRSSNPFGFKLDTFMISSDRLRYDIPGDGNLPLTFGEYVNTDEGAFYYRNQGIFQESNTARFIRLQVREYGQQSNVQDFGLRDSHIGAPGNRKYSWDAPDLNNLGTDEDRLLNYTFIPEDFNEWYFICATYNPNVVEPIPSSDETEGTPVDENPIRADLYNEYMMNPDFWLNHINEDGSYTNFSGFGNKCKVEIISKTDLLRARGFKV